MPTAYPCTTPDFIPGQAGNRLRQYGTFGKVVLVNGAMNGVDFNGGNYVETSLLKA